MAFGAQLVHGGVQVAVCATEAYNEQVGVILVAQHLQVGYLYVVNLLLTQAGHQVVVLRVGGDGPRLVVLLQSAEDMLKALASGHSPVAHAVGIALVGSPAALQLIRHVGWLDGGIFVQFGQTEGSAAVGNVGISHQHHGSHVLQGHLACCVSSVKAVGRRCGGYHWHGALAVAAEEHLQQVCLLRLGRQTGGRASALHIDYHQWQLHDDSQVHGLRLEADARSRSRGDGHRSSKGGSYG